MLQLSGKRGRAAGGRKHLLPLSELTQGEQAVIEQLDMAHDDAQRMMELGFLPGALVLAARSAPGGDPRIYRVDGSEFAIRRETASRLTVRPRQPARKAL